MKSMVQAPGKMKQMYDEAKQTQNKMKAIVIKGKSNSEDVEVVINGLHEVLEVEIDDDLLDPSRKKVLTKGLKEAFKDANKKYEKEMMKDMDLDKLKSLLGS